MPAIVGYRLLGVIADGNISTVFIAEQESLGRQVALKVMRSDALADEVSRRRFENEIRTVGRLQHAHIVGIHHMGRTTDGLPYYAMPYVSHGHLRQRDFRGDETAVRAVLRNLLSALSHAHGRGVIHRDVKAENVLFDAAGQALLADFGIALRRGYGSRVTSAGLAVGSTAYMAPEQARGEEVDPRADLYSVGVLAWEMLVGELPYQAGDALAMAVKHARDPIPRLPRHLRHWQRFMDRALAKNPLKRFHDANQMLGAIEQLPGPTRATAFSPGRWMRALATAPGRVPGFAWIVGGLVMAALLGLGLRHTGPVAGDGDEGFFRAGSSAPPAVRDRLGDIGRGSPMVDLAAPESQAGRLIEDARKQIKTRRLTTPIGDNAYDSLLQAAAADAEHLELGPAAAELVGALGQEAALRLQRDDTPGAVDALTKATRMGALVAPAAATQLAGTRRAMARAIEVRIAAAAHRFDRDAARAAFAVAGSIRLDPASRERLAAQIDAIPAVGQAVPGDPGGMTVQRAGDGAYALTRRLISREEYARFAEATGREPALCRERASLLRMLSPRDWTSPGFDQQADDAVVCVAWDDADAFARWLGRQNGGNYRLPAAGEAGLLAAAPGGRKLSEWLLDCSDDCQTRAVSGDSWRRGGSPARAGRRGYDDVGFRLVREP